MAKEFYPLNALPKEYGEMISWLSEICRQGNVNDFVMADYNDNINLFNFIFYTKDNRYRISCLPYSMTRREYKNGKEITGENHPSYLGATVTQRKPRAGEDWNRGNDLADGEYSRKTWEIIKNHITAYELVKIAKQSLPIEDTPLPLPDCKVA